MRKLCIGIAGFGVVGRSYLRYLCHYGTAFIAHKAQQEGFALGEIAIWDEKEILDKESIAQSFLKITIYDKNAISFETFLQICDYVLIVNIYVGIARQHSFNSGNFCRIPK